MSVGLRIYKDGVDTILDTTSRTGRVLGILVNPATSGSLTDIRFTDGQPWAEVTLNPSTGYVVSELGGDPVAGLVTWSGTTMSWAVPWNTPFRIVYGVS